MSTANLARGVRIHIPASYLELHLLGMTLSQPSLPGVLLPGVSALDGDRRATWTMDHVAVRAGGPYPGHHLLMHLGVHFSF